MEHDARRGLDSTAGDESNRGVSQEPTNRLLANPFAEETFALAAFGPLWCIEREPEGKQ
jgi:hypothetical protein